MLCMQTKQLQTEKRSRHVLLLAVALLITLFFSGVHNFYGLPDHSSQLQNFTYLAFFFLKFFLFVKRLPHVLKTVQRINTALYNGNRGTANNVQMSDTQRKACLKVFIISGEGVHYITKEFFLFIVFYLLLRLILRFLKQQQISKASSIFQLIKSQRQHEHLMHCTVGG